MDPIGSTGTAMYITIPLQRIVVYTKRVTTETTPPAGWYRDPTGAPQQRYWTGRQWTAAIAAPTVLAIPVPASPPAPTDWISRHPIWTALIVFWLACMLSAWTWLGPTLALAGLVAWALRWDRRRRKRLAADADRQNALLLQGDPRGAYGDFTPAAAE
jgi:hypothetical protein